jgi:hypothetical protein
MPGYAGYDGTTEFVRTSVDEAPILYGVPVMEPELLTSDRVELMPRLAPDMARIVHAGMPFLRHPCPNMCRYA